MNVLTHLITYVSLLVFIIAVIVRFIRIQTYPLNLRWELYPVPHEGERAKHGGSILEEGDWWTKSRKASLAMELKFMLPEMLFIKALFEHNRKLWYRSFPFHFGLYILAGFAALLIAGAALELAGAPFGKDAGVLAAALTTLTAIAGAAGLALTILGGLSLLAMRLTDEDLKPYTTFSHILNLLFIVGAVALVAIAWATTGWDFAPFREYVASLLRFQLSASSKNVWVAVSVIACSLLVAYIPLTHMSHFFVKWFTWHKIRWDDEPNVRGGRIEVMIQKALQRPVSWAAPHINADGRKSWGEIAMEDLKQQ